MVDEYQDTNSIQYELCKLLASRYKNIFVVGDANQSIYSFRNADYRNILNFEKDYKNTKVILLEENYRSTNNILKAANSVIKNNSEGKKLNLWSSKRDGELIDYIRCEDEIKEANFVINKIKDLISNGYDKMLNSLDKLISKQKELLNSKKDLYDYENNITNQTKDIANLRKQLEAYKYDNSENKILSISLKETSSKEISLSAINLTFFFLSSSLVNFLHTFSTLIISLPTFYLNYIIYFTTITTEKELFY